MRGGIALVAALVVAAVRPAPVAADAAADADALVAEGENLARAGEYTRAIDQFKRADATLQRSRHACLIGLVYTRRELWSQAELFFARCRERATTADPVPDWLPEAERQLAAKLAEVEAAPVDIKVEPAGVAATLSIVGYPADETFAPRVIHLGAGVHSITATADGYEPTTERVEVKGKDPITVTITLQLPGAEVEPMPLPSGPPPRPRQRNVGKWLLIGAGGVAALGIGFHLLASNERDYLARALDDNNVMLYDEHETRFDVFRAATFACYGAAVTAAVVGVVLHVTRDKESSAPEVGGMITADGGFVTFGWRR